MAALQCEICGGRLVGKPGGIFECDSCGMEYNTEWAKAKIQEIQGTVKVEGTVNVAGSVKVEGPVQIDRDRDVSAKVKNGMKRLKNEKWEEAKKYFDEALDIDPENAEALLGYFMIGHGVKDLVALQSKYIEGKYFQTKEFKEIFAYAKGELKTILDQWAKKEQEYLEKRSETNAAKKQYLAEKRNELKKFKGLIAACEDTAYYVNLDGTVGKIPLSEPEYYPQYDLSTWQNIRAIYCCDGTPVGIKNDGTIILPEINRALPREMQQWKNICEVVASREGKAIGLHSDGTVVIVAGTNEGLKKEVSTWRNVVGIGLCEIYGGRVYESPDDEEGTYLYSWLYAGLKADGRFLVATESNHDKDSEDKKQCLGLKKWMEEQDEVADFGFRRENGFKYYCTTVKTDGTVVDSHDGDLMMDDIVLINNKCISANCTVSTRKKQFTDIIAIHDPDNSYTKVDACNYIAVKKDGSIEFDSYYLYQEKFDHYLDYCERHAAFERSSSRLYETQETLINLRLFHSMETFEQERADVQKERQEKAQKLRAEIEEFNGAMSENSGKRNALEEERNKLNPLFGAGRRMELLGQMEELERENQRLQSKIDQLKRELANYL